MASGNAAAANNVTSQLTQAITQLASMNSTSPMVASMMNQTMAIMNAVVQAGNAMTKDCAAA